MNIHACYIILASPHPNLRQAYVQYLTCFGYASNTAGHLQVQEC